MSKVRRLVQRDGMWQVDVLDEPTSDACVGEAVVIPPDGGGCGLWVGRSGSGRRVVGWSEPRETLAGPVSELWEVPESVDPNLHPRELALLLPTVAIAAAMRDVAPLGRSGIIGNGPLSAIAQGVLKAAPMHEPTTAGDALDTLVDLSAEPARFTPVLRRIADEGTVLAMVPPWAGPVDINFYPHIHERSLRLVARRWHRAPDGIDAGLLRDACDLAIDVARSLRPLQTGDAEPEHWAELVWSAV